MNKKPKWKKKFLHHTGKLIVIAMLLLPLALITASTQVSKQNLYPQGQEFPLVLYSIHEVEEMQKERVSGWNVAQTYHFNPLFLQTVADGHMLALAHLPGESEPIPEAEAAKIITNLAKSDQVAWWEFPEEQRYWREGEMAIVTKYAKWTRKYDPKKRPNYMYIPGHYDAESIQQYVPYLDIIPASVYTQYANKPHAWVRWRMETILKGIKLAKAKVGYDYLHGEKIPVAVLELFHEEGNAITTPEGAYHDFWQSIVSGARGILVFSYWHKRDHPELEKVWQMYSKAAREITGTEQIGTAILYGQRLDSVGFEIVAGAKSTKKFESEPNQETITFPALNLLTIVWNQHTYIIAVNSAEKSVSASITGLPKDITQAKVLFEDRSVAIKNGRFNIAFPPLGVHIFKF